MKGHSVHLACARTRADSEVEHLRTTAIKSTEEYLKKIEKLHKLGGQLKPLRHNNARTVHVAELI